MTSLTTDDLAEQFGHPDLLFIDVEGYECEVLSGSAETLLRRPDCVVEVHTQVGLETLGGSPEQTLSYFPADDYTIYTALQEQCFQEHQPGATLPRQRFYLVALARKP